MTRALVSVCKLLYYPRGEGGSAPPPVAAELVSRNKDTTAGFISLPVCIAYITRPEAGFPHKIIFAVPLFHHI